MFSNMHNWAPVVVTTTAMPPLGTTACHYHGHASTGPLPCMQLTPLGEESAGVVPVLLPVVDYSGTTAMPPLGQAAPWDAFNRGNCMKNCMRLVQGVTWPTLLVRPLIQGFRHTTQWWVSPTQWGSPTRINFLQKPVPLIENIPPQKWTSGTDAIFDIWQLVWKSKTGEVIFCTNELHTCF